MNSKVFPTLIVTVGLPRSGKSTWAIRQGHPIVCPSSIRKAMHGQRYIKEAEPLIWATAKIMVNQLFLSGHDTVILDATNITAEHRSYWCSHQWKTIFRFFDVDELTCRARATEMHDFAILPIISEMASQFEPLTTAELLLIDQRR